MKLAATIVRSLDGDEDQAAYGRRAMPLDAPQTLTDDQRKPALSRAGRQRGVPPAHGAQRQR